jgi:lipid-binding SYLF domain-containing protein
MSLKSHGQPYLTSLTGNPRWIKPDTNLTLFESRHIPCARGRILGTTGTLPEGIVKIKSVFLLACLTLLATHAIGETTPDKRLRNAAASIKEVMDIPDKGIPHDLFDKAQCIIIIPGLKKGAFVWGGKYGRGFASCRQNDRGWSAPAAVGIEGGSFGLQIGGSSTDVIMLVMNQKGMSRLLEDKFTLGGDAAIAAGPVGRETSADTDVLAKAEILSWSRSRGLFIGLSLEGATLHADGKENEKLYGKPTTNREILAGDFHAPRVTYPLVCTLDSYTAGVTSPCGGNGRHRRNATAESLSTSGRTTLNNVRFATGKADILPSSRAALNDALSALKSNPDWKIRVEGYTDNAGKSDANQSLSERRAQAVLDWLVKHGIDSSRLTAKGVGDSNPIADNSIAAGRAINRRVELVKE